MKCDEMGDYTNKLQDAITNINVLIIIYNYCHKSASLFLIFEF